MDVKMDISTKTIIELFNLINSARDSVRSVDEYDSIFCDDLKKLMFNIRFCLGEADMILEESITIDYEKNYEKD